VSRLRIDVRLGETADVASVRSEGADAIVIATGAEYDRTGYSLVAAPGRQTIPGLAEAHVMTPVEAIEESEAVGGSVVVFDDTGEHLPLGLSLMLARSGRTVTLITPRLTVGEEIIRTEEFPWVYPKVIAAGARIRTQMTIQSVGPSAVIATSIWGLGEPEEIGAETLILSLTRTAANRLYAELSGDGPELYRIGDCVAPRKIDDAIYDGMRVGLAL
jgi:hypothetical protein